MKYVIAAILLSMSISAPAAPPTLKEHMAAMGYILDSIWVAANDQQTYQTAADKTAELREHLTQAIALTPNSIATMEPRQRRTAVIDYHQLMARTIHLTASLEQAFSQSGPDPVSGSRQQDIQNLLREISVVVGRGHGRYRGK